MCIVKEFNYYSLEKAVANMAAIRIKHHHTYVRIIRSVIKEIISKTNVASDWITLVGKRVVSLKIYEIDQDGNSINLLFDKRPLYRRLTDVSKINNVYTASRLVWLCHFMDMPSNVFRMMNCYNFEEICRSIIDKAEQLGVSSDKISQWRDEFVKT